VVDTNGLPVHLPLMLRHTTIGCVRLFSAHCFQRQCCSRIADTTRTGSGNLPVSKEHGRTFRRKRNRKDPICFSPHLYRARNLIERFFNKIKQCQRVATRYDKLAANYPAFVKLASIRIWLRANESTSYRESHSLSLSHCNKPYSITSSARASRVGGISRPELFAVFKFSTKRYRVGCSKGKSAGWAPLKMTSDRRRGRKSHIRRSPEASCSRHIQRPACG